MLNFTAIDVETANSDRGSVCAVGLSLVRDGQLFKTVEWHVRPPTGVDRFDTRNIRIHGITPDMVRAAATWDESLSEIVSLSGQHPLVAFNAAFDKSVVIKASALVGMEPPANPFHCALKLSQRLMTLDQYKLPIVARELGLASFVHHNAGSDAETCAKVVLALSEIHDLRTVNSLWVPASASARPKAKPGPNAFSKANRAAIADLPQPNPDADPSHPFFGRQVIITGDLESCSRWEAAEAIAHVGGVNGKGVTKKTAFLVVGDGRTHDQIELETGTTKERKAAAYINAGQNIQILTESEYSALVMASLSQELRILAGVRKSEAGDAAADGDAPEPENDGTWLNERELYDPSLDVPESESTLGADGDAAEPENGGTWLNERELSDLLPDVPESESTTAGARAGAASAKTPISTATERRERVDHVSVGRGRRRTNAKSSSFVFWLLILAVVATVAYLLGS